MLINSLIECLETKTWGIHIWILNIDQFNLIFVNNIWIGNERSRTIWAIWSICAKVCAPTPQQNTEFDIKSGSFCAVCRGKKRSWRCLRLNYVHKIRMNCPTSKECTFCFRVDFHLWFRWKYCVGLRFNTVWFICHGYMTFFCFWVNNIIHMSQFAL